MSFDRIAPHYRWMEALLAGGKLQRCRTTALPGLPTPEDILLLGEGHGRFLVPCRRRFPAARIVCIEASGGMIRQARRRLVRETGSDAGVEFRQEDALSAFVPSGAFDLVATHFFLDCFTPEQLATLVPSLARGLRPGGRWLVADFQAGGGPLARLRNRAILAAMYAFFRLATDLPARRLTPPDAYLRAAGLRLESRQETEWGLLHSDCWVHPDHSLLPA